MFIAKFSAEVSAAESKKERIRRRFCTLNHVLPVDNNESVSLFPKILRNRCCTLKELSGCICYQWALTRCLPFFREVEKRQKRRRRKIIIFSKILITAFHVECRRSRIKECSLYSVFTSLVVPQKITLYVYYMGRD